VTGPSRVGMAWTRLNLRTRITVLVAVAVGLAVAMASVAGYLTVRHELRSRLDSNLEQRATAAAQTQLVNDITRFGRIPDVVLALATDVRVALVTSGGDRIVFSGAPVPPIGSPETAVANGIVHTSLRSATEAGVSYRVVAVAVRPGLALVLAQSTTATDHELGRLALVLLIVGLAGIVVAACAGLAVARAGLRPVERLTAATEHVARTQELTSIPVQGDDELARLTGSFNLMLEALEQSRERQRQLVADAGHELRTPLTSLRTNLDLLAQSARPGGPTLDPADRDELLADVRAQAQELTVLVGDLVELARTDSPAIRPEPIDLRAVIDRAIDRVRRRAPGLAYAVAAEPWIVIGDPTALERAVTNLLDNAAKWSPPGATVTVTLRDGVLQVADQGPGIAPADLPHVFDRFYRAVDARGLPGSGLGLAIVRQAADRHGGVVAAGTAPGGGALFTLRLPGHAPARA
jgi:two-component system, OmpR family, sensor histidine kinase MprB